MMLRRRLAHLLEQKYPYYNVGACYDRLLTALTATAAASSTTNAVDVATAGGDT